MERSEPQAKIALLLLITVATIPFSVKLYARSIDLEVIFPAEPLIAVLAVFTTWLVVRRFRTHGFEWKIGPLSLTVLAFLAASLLSSITSTMPMISFKAMTVRLAYAISFFFAPLMLPGPIRRVRGYLLLHAWLLLPITLWTLSAQIEGGLDRASAGFVSYPFYIDRTIYSAAVTFGVFALLASAFGRFGGSVDPGGFTLHIVGGGILLCGVLFSYTRAAWLSMIVVGVLLLMWSLRRRPGMILVVAILCSLGAGFVVHSLRTNSAWETNANAHRTGISAMARSFTNLHTDPSNMERINRWSCAWRMFLDRPLLGHGPGTYQFVFLSYQRSTERTQISPPDTAWLNHVSERVARGRAVIMRPPVMQIEYSGGSAHSEYLLSLSEGGVIGGLAWLAVVCVGTMIGIGRWRETCTGAPVLHMALLGLTGYAVHGMFNNYLEDCKVAMPFWLSMAALAACSGARIELSREA